MKTKLSRPLAITILILAIVLLAVALPGWVFLGAMIAFCYLGWYLTGADHE